MGKLGKDAGYRVTTAKVILNFRMIPVKGFYGSKHFPLKVYLIFIRFKIYYFSAAMH